MSIEKDVNNTAANAFKNGGADSARAATIARAKGPRRKADDIILETLAENWPTPIPLHNIETPPLFPARLFPKWLEDFTGEITRALEVPLDLAGFCALGVLATVFQKRFAVRIDSGYSEPLSLHLVCGLEPGARKSPVFKLFFDPIHEFENRENTRLKPIILDAKRRQAQIEKNIGSLQSKLANKKNLGNEADLDSAYKDLDALKVPVAPMLTIDDATPEAVADNLDQQGGRLTIASAEGAFLEILKGRYSESPAIEVCLKGHAGDPLKIHRKDKHKPPIILRAPALSMILCIQPSVIATFGKVESLAGRGLLSRIVFALPNSNLGFRQHDREPVDETVKANYCNRMLKLLESPIAEDQTTREIETEIISCSRDVQTAVKDLSREIEPEMQPGKSLRDKSGFLSGFGGKAVGLAVRIAGLLALADCRIEVNLADFERGKRFIKYAIGHARIVSGFVAEDPATTDARRILEWIARKGERTIKRRDVCRDLNLKTVEATAALKLLEDHEFLRPIGAAMNAGPGRKPAPGAQTFDVNPHFLSDSKSAY